MPIRSCLTLALALLLAAPAFAQTEAWNQEKVIVLAEQLEAAVAGLRDAVRKSPQWENPQQKPALYRIADKLRLIESESTSLHAQLKNGAGMEETLPAYARIQRLRRDVVTLAKRTEVSSFTQPKLDIANSVLGQIAPYYPPQPQPKS